MTKDEIIRMAFEAKLICAIDDPVTPWSEVHDLTEELEAFAKLVREDERGRMCEQLKECSSEKSTSNEANRSAFLGEGGQAN